MAKKNQKQYMNIHDVWEIDVVSTGYLGGKMDIVISGRNLNGRRVQVKATLGIGASDDIVRKISSIVTKRVNEYTQLKDLVKQATQS